MSRQLIEKNPDLKRLKNEGYEIEVSGGFLLIHHVPYVNSRREVQYGVLVTELHLPTPEVVQYDGQHVIKFAGDYPCDKDGNILTAIKHADLNTTIAGVTVNYSFSNKP